MPATSGYSGYILTDELKDKLVEIANDNGSHPDDYDPQDDVMLRQLYSLNIGDEVPGQIDPETDDYDANLAPVALAIEFYGLQHVLDI